MPSDVQLNSDLTTPSDRAALKSLPRALWWRYLLSMTLMMAALIAGIALADREARFVAEDAKLQNAALRAGGASQRTLRLATVNEAVVITDVSKLNVLLDTSLTYLLRNGGPRTLSFLAEDAGGRTYGEALRDLVREVDLWLVDGRDLMGFGQLLLPRRYEGLSGAVAADSKARAARAAWTERGLLAMALAMALLMTVFVFRPGHRAIAEALRSLYDRNIRLAAAKRDIAQRNQALQRALDEGEQLRREQAEFTYAISHDLKSPSNTIGLLLDEIGREVDRLGPESREYFDMAQKTVERMQALVESVLVYSRATGGSIPDDGVRLDIAIDDALADLKADIDASGARIGRVGAFPPVRGDAVLTRLLVQNLVSNAIKFRVPGRAPQVTIAGEGPDAFGRVTLSVEDNGIGIAEADRERIFGLFQRLHLAEQYPGSGIGLALCRRIATSVGGEIHVRSRPGTGSTFDVLLPAKAA